MIILVCQLCGFIGALGWGGSIVLVAFVQKKSAERSIRDNGKEFWKGAAGPVWVV